jgi:hypothetical protein
MSSTFRRFLSALLAMFQPLRRLRASRARIDPAAFHPQRPSMPPDVGDETTDVRLWSSGEGPVPFPADAYATAVKPLSDADARWAHLCRADRDPAAALLKAMTGVTVVPEESPVIIVQARPRHASDQDGGSHEPSSTTRSSG